MFSLPTLVYIISSIISFVLIYLRFPPSTFQQLTAILIVAILILVSRVVANRTNVGQIRYILGLFLSSFFAQVLVLATGGIYSSFLILIHLFTLGSSFLINIPSSIIFLLLTLGILIINIYYNPQMLAIFNNDPGSAVLYFISFIVIIPLTQYIVYRYHLKDTIFKALKEYAETGEQREASILNNISELVVITDKNLNILSTNEAFEQSLNLIQDACVNHPMLEVVPLKDRDSHQLTLQELSIPQILSDKVTRIMDGFFYQSPSDPKPKLVSIQIRPVLNSEGDVTQLIFLITDPDRHKGLQKHSDLQQALAKQKMMVEDLKNTLIKAGLPNVVSKIELLNKTENDLFLAYEIEDHPITPNLNPEDIALIGKQVVASEQSLARYVGVTLQFVLPEEEVVEASHLRLVESRVEPVAILISSFTALIDKQWFTVLLQKLLDIGLFLASGKSNQQINLNVEQNMQDNNLINLNINIPFQLISDQEIKKLFIEYYPDFTIKSNLYLGSGLEGFIAKNILDQLNIPFNAKFDQGRSILSFSFSISKALKQV